MNRTVCLVGCAPSRRVLLWLGSGPVLGQAAASSPAADHSGRDQTTSGQRTTTRDTPERQRHAPMAGGAGGDERANTLDSQASGCLWQPIDNRSIGGSSSGRSQATEEATHHNARKKHSKVILCGLENHGFGVRTAITLRASPTSKCRHVSLPNRR